MEHEALEKTANTFKENYKMVVAEPKYQWQIQTLFTGILNLDSGEMIICEKKYFSTYTKNEVKECFILHDYNDWSV